MAVLEHDGRQETVKVDGAYRVMTAILSLGWALDGHGILIRSEWDLAKYLGERTPPRRPARLTRSPPLTCSCITPSAGIKPPERRAFIDFLVEQFQA